MSAASKRNVANRGNAQLSTGPKSVLGKSKSSGNALGHGILSKRLLLADENPDDYQALFQGLLAELEPVGTMEQLLVERIAVSVWRQRRLVSAEAASIAEKQSLTDYQTLVRIRTIAQLDPKDDEWIKEIIRDIPSREPFVRLILQLESLHNSDVVVGIQTLKKQQPDVWSLLCDEAEIDASNTHAAQCEQIQSHLKENKNGFGRWQLQTLFNFRKTLRLIDAALTVRSALALPLQADLVSRYQAALDNEWFKALRTLREAQKLRLDQAVLNAKAVSG